MLDIESSKPTLLTHGDCNEITNLDQFRLGEMLVQTRPQRVVGRQVPSDALGVSQCGFLLIVVPRRRFKIDEIAIIVFDDTGFRRLH